MSQARLTGTRHTPGAPTPEPTPPAQEKHVPKRRKTPPRRDTAALRRELLACIAAVAAALTALGVTAPHLANNTAPDPSDWSVLLAMAAVLGLACWSVHHNQHHN